MLQVLEIITLRRDGLRGQGWVIFEDVQAATAALNAEQGFTFFGRELKLSYANEKSDRIAKRDGSYVPKAKRRKREDQKNQTTASNDKPPVTTTTTNVETSTNEDQPPPSPPETTAVDATPPSHILLATDLPADVNEMMLSMLFRQYDGFAEVRLPRDGLAFIEFDTEPHATLALERLNGFQLTKDDSLKLTYGKA